MMPDEASGLWIHPDSIREQRIKGWVDFHPEDFCHKCGQRNVHAWSADSAEWNRVEEATGSTILCPQCFTETYTLLTGRLTPWELRSTQSIYESTRHAALLKEAREVLAECVEPAHDSLECSSCMEEGPCCEAALAYLLRKIEEAK